MNQAYDNLGATSDAYDQLAGIDLTELIGTTAASGDKALMSTVRWCFTDEDCPYDNAFWDGTQMVFGAGYAAADDVVAHELTHGYVERTSALFYFHQSGAINESVSDVIGEIVDHRNPESTASDANWLIGEDLPGGWRRAQPQEPAALRAAGPDAEHGLRERRRLHRRRCRARQRRRRQQGRLPDLAGRHLQRPHDDRHRQRGPDSHQDRTPLPRRHPAAHLRLGVRRPRTRPGQHLRRVRRLEHRRLHPGQLRLGGHGCRRHRAVLRAGRRRARQLARLPCGARRRTA